MLQGHIRLGRIGGTEINLHYSWFIIAALITISLAAQLFSVNSDWPAPLVWTTAAVTAVAFFAAIVLHELSHATVARAQNIPVPSITLFALGGVARMGREPRSAGGEFWIAIAGPIMSVAIGIVALAVARAAGWTQDALPQSPAMVMLVWFGFINIALAAFNLVPGFPLDGGRILRAIVWKWTGDQVRGTRIAANVGQAVAMAFIVIGLLSVFRGAGFGGLWLAIIGMFLSGAARAEAFHAVLQQSLRDVRVSDVMSTDCPVVERGRPLSEIADEVLRTGRRCFFVVDGGKVGGMLTLKDLRGVPRERWAATPAAEVMKPLDKLLHVEADTPVVQALEVIAREDINQLPVLEHGQLRGVISRDQILRLISTRAELGWGL